MFYSPILQGERPNAPDTWHRSTISRQDAMNLGLAPTTTTNMISYPLTWHHNIPWKTLRDSWNILFTFGSQDNLGKAFDLYSTGVFNDALLNKLKAIQSALAPTDTTLSGATYEKWLRRISNGSESLLSSLQGPKQLTADEEDALFSLVAWQKWNIVEGPKESVRVEDPGSDAFDDFRFTVPAHHTPALYERFERVSNYFDALHAVVEEYERVKAQFANRATVANWNALLGEALTAAAPLKTQQMVLFGKDYWKTITWQGMLRTKNIEGLELYEVAKNQAPHP